jgi:hypothetical protein
MPSTDDVVFEGLSLDDVMDEVYATLGHDATIVDALKVRSGGIGGFFSKEQIRVTARPTAPTQMSATISLRDADDFDRPMLGSGATGATGAHAAAMRTNRVVDDEPLASRDAVEKLLALAEEVSLRDRSYVTAPDADAMVDVMAGDGRSEFDPDDYGTATRAATRAARFDLALRQARMSDDVAADLRMLPTIESTPVPEVSGAPRPVVRKARPAAPSAQPSVSAAPALDRVQSSEEPVIDLTDAPQTTIVTHTRDGGRRLATIRPGFTDAPRLTRSGADGAPVPVVAPQRPTLKRKAVSADVPATADVPAARPVLGPKVETITLPDMTDRGICAVVGDLDLARRCAAALLLAADRDAAEIVVVAPDVPDDVAAWSAVTDPADIAKRSPRWAQRQTAVVLAIDAVPGFAIEVLDELRSTGADMMVVAVTDRDDDPSGVRRALASLGDIDALVIDGDPAATGPLARLGVPVVVTAPGAAASAPDCVAVPQPTHMTTSTPARRARPTVIRTRRRVASRS